jgi:peptidoglycan/LPS O-acetylase OafA/YrhL
VQRYALRVFVLLAAVVMAMELFAVPGLAPYPLLSALWREGLRYSLLAVGFACLIAWALRPHSMGKQLFEQSWLRFLGKYSYGIYVLHVFVLSALALPLRTAIAAATHSKGLGVGLAGILSLLVAVGAAWLSYHLYERPFLRLKHHFDYQRAALNHGAAEDVPTTSSII